MTRLQWQVPGANHGASPYMTRFEPDLSSHGDTSLALGNEMVMHNLCLCRR